MDFIEQLKKEKVRLLSLVSSIDNLLAQYDSFSIEFKTSSLPITKAKLDTVRYTEPKYKIPSFKKKTLSLKDRVKDVVLNLDKFSKSSDIVETLFSYYPERKKDEPQFKVQISGILSKLGNEGEIIRYQYSTSKRDTVWGKKEFLDEKGDPKLEFLEYII